MLLVHIFYAFFQMKNLQNSSNKFIESTKRINIYIVLFKLWLTISQWENLFAPNSIWKIFILLEVNFRVISLAELFSTFNLQEVLWKTFALIVVKPSTWKKLSTWTNAIKKLSRIKKQGYRDRLLNILCTIFLLLSFLVGK